MGIACFRILWYIYNYIYIYIKHDLVLQNSKSSFKLGDDHQTE